MIEKFSLLRMLKKNKLKENIPLKLTNKIAYFSKTTLEQIHR